jgi:putative addiction module CopG family antidote
MPTISIELPAALERFVASQVREGTYCSREAAIVAAVSHQKQRSEQLAWLQTKIQKGIVSGPAGKLNIESVIPHTTSTRHRISAHRLRGHSCRRDREIGHHLRLS